MVLPAQDAGLTKCMSVRSKRSKVGWSGSPQNFINEFQAFEVTVSNANEASEQKSLFRFCIKFFG